MSLQQEIRFCTTPDGVRIAYSTMGEGPPLVRAAHWLTHLEYDLHTPVWQGWLREGSATVDSDRPHHRQVNRVDESCGIATLE